MKVVLNNFRERSNLLKGTLILSLLIFFISLAFPPFLTEENLSEDANSGSLFLFLFGWMSFLAGGYIYFIIWLANPLYFMAIFIIASNRKRSLYLNAITVSLAIAFTQVDTMMVSESPRYSKIVSLGLGFKLWLLSFIILLLGNVFDYIISKKKSL